MEYEKSPEGAIFVFGSNLAGRHGAGAAQYALANHGAQYGNGKGPQGESYAIPTKNHKLRPLPLKEIEMYVVAFLTWAECTPDKTFFVTAIGTGYAGYSHIDIAPMFKRAPKNCILPKEWKHILDEINQDRALWDEVDAEVNRIMAMSEPQLRALMEGEGKDWDTEVASARACLDRALEVAFAAEQRRKARLRLLMQ